MPESDDDRIPSPDESLDEMERRLEDRLQRIKGADPQPTLAELDAQLGDAISELEARRDAIKAPEIPDPALDPEFEARLSAVKAKADAALSQRRTVQAARSKAERSDQESSRGLAFGLSIAYTIIGLPLFGYGVGYLIDQSAGGDVWKGLCMLIGAVIGIVFAVYQLNRQNQTS